jgi:hypothetical protein
MLRFARGGVRPSSEAEIRPRSALERGRDFAVLRPTLEGGGDYPEVRRGLPLRWVG